jgi:apolipoprotein D and lipocalin family protein
MTHWKQITGIALFGLGLVGCAAPKLPMGVEPVQGFQLERYLGTWHEVARLDHSFERGMERVTANYSLRDDGGVRVLNKGFRSEKQDWKEAEGKAFFVREPTEAFLKVSFFGPFYGSYIVFDLDTTAYGHAFVSGPDTSYLWLLSRTPVISDSLRQRFVTMASARGFDTSALIWVKQTE